MELRQLQYTRKSRRIKIFPSRGEASYRPTFLEPAALQAGERARRLLFQRNTSNVELTHAGASFVEHAQKIMDAVERLKQEMSDISQLRKGKVVVGACRLQVLTSATGFARL